MMRKSVLIILLIGLLAGATMLSGCSNTSTDKAQNSKETLLVYSGAGLVKPMEELGNAFEAKTGVKIEYVFGGSSQNLAQIETTMGGDVWTPGSMADCETAIEKGLIKSNKEIVYHIPIIAVPKGNPAGIQSLQDLGNDGVKLVLGDEQSCAIGKAGKKIFEANGLTQKVAANTIAKTANVTELLTYMELNQADATMIWEDETQNNDKIEKIEIPKEQNQIKTIPVAILKTSKKIELAQQFADYVASEEGLKTFQKYGFKPIQ